MIWRLIFLSIRLLGICSVACAIAWIGGGYIYVFFNGGSYSPGWSDVKAIAKNSVIIAAAYVFLAWLNIRRL